jgi:hypothetical protein
MPAHAKDKNKPAGFTATAADVWVYSLTFGPGVLLLAAVWLQTRVPVSVLMKDPLAVVHETKTCCHFYYGLVSNLGIMIWTAGAAVSLFAALLLFCADRPKSEMLFFAAAAAFTTWLALDDLFMIHEDVLPQLGVPEAITYGLYGSAAAGYFLLSWRAILESRPMLMALALILLGSSVGIDVLVKSESAARVFVEDGAKLLGILAWASFHVSAAVQIIGARMEGSSIFSEKLDQADRRTSGRFSAQNTSAS